MLPTGGPFVSEPVARVLGKPWSNQAMLARVRAAYLGAEADWPLTERRIGALWRLCGTEVRTLEEDAPSPVAEHAARCARELLAREGVAAHEVDLVVHGDLVREVYEPATAAEVADRVGAHGALPLDVSSACASAVLAIQDVVARMAVDPDLRVALVTTATLSAGHVRYDLHGPDDVDTLGAGLTLGNAASAMLVTRARPAREAGWGEVVALHAAGLPAHQALCRAPIGGAFVSHGAELFALARHVPAHFEALCARAGWRTDEVDAWWLHQPSHRALRDLARMAGIPPARVPLHHGAHGNCAASAVPLVWAAEAALGRVRPGARVVLSAAASGFVVAGVALRMCGAPSL